MARMVRVWLRWGEAIRPADYYADTWDWFDDRLRLHSTDDNKLTLVAEIRTPFVVLVEYPHDSDSEAAPSEPGTSVSAVG